MFLYLPRFVGELDLPEEREDARYLTAVWARSCSLSMMTRSFVG